VGESVGRSAFVEGGGDQGQRLRGGPKASRRGCRSGISHLVPKLRQEGHRGDEHSFSQLI
jgi:hypothetical protein